MRCELRRVNSPPKIAPSGIVTRVLAGEQGVWEECREMHWRDDSQKTPSDLSTDSVILGLGVRYAILTASL